MDYYDERESDLEFFKKGFSFIFNSIFFIIILVFLLMMPISMTYTGIKHLMDCPIQPKIPLYLFVGGSVGIVKMLNVIYEQWKTRKKEKFDQGDLVDVDGFDSGGGGGGDGGGLNTSSKFVDIVMSLFLTIWFCFGNYWVFTTWKPNFVQPRGEGSNKWCSRDAYMLAVYHIFFVYILAIFFFLIVCILFIITKCRQINQDLDNQDENNA